MYLFSIHLIILETEKKFNKASIHVHKIFSSVDEKIATVQHDNNTSSYCMVLFQICA